ncbi:GrpB family protein [Rhizobium leguminosarum]|uniref:GrpB family protein n=1 Tax=Rhizobium leguminosarum TaxID=384 RepID=UPI001FEE614B|nr:GrpB family protein [Rhizobium leguminosarum]
MPSAVHRRLTSWRTRCAISPRRKPRHGQASTDVDGHADRDRTAATKLGRRFRDIQARHHASGACRSLSAHIGSTAVPGLPAKDIIDIQLTADDLAEIDNGAFERAGFERRPIVTTMTPAFPAFDGRYVPARRCVACYL